jgi:transcription antitermination factor NusG
MIPLSKNPPARFPQKPIIESAHPWWIAKVKPRQEKALAFDLMQWEIDYYMPLYTKQTRRQDNNKIRKSIICLFPGYLPFSAQSGFERQIYATDRIVNIVTVLHQKRFIREIEQIYRTLDLGLPVEPLESIAQFVAGKPVQIQHGPMKGICGTVIKIKGGSRLLLSVEGLGQAVVTVPAEFVALLPDDD